MTGRSRTARPLADVLLDALGAGATEFQISDDEYEAAVQWVEATAPTWTPGEAVQAAYAYLADPRGTRDLDAERVILGLLDALPTFADAGRSREGEVSDDASGGAS